MPVGYITFRRVGSAYRQRAQARTWGSAPGGVRARARFAHFGATGRAAGRPGNGVRPAAVADIHSNMTGNL